MPPEGSEKPRDPRAISYKGDQRNAATIYISYKFANSVGHLRPFLNHIKAQERKRMKDMEKEEAPTPRTPASRVKAEPKASLRGRR